MMSLPDFRYKQVIFFRVADGDKLSFRADNIVIESKNKQVKFFGP